MRTVELRFVNHWVDELEQGDAPQVDIIFCNAESVPQIMAWYGAYFAGDRYQVFKDGTEIQIDQNGEKVSEIIEGELS